MVVSKTINEVLVKPFKSVFVTDLNELHVLHAEAIACVKITSVNVKGLRVHLPMLNTRKQPFLVSVSAADVTQEVLLVLTHLLFSTNYLFVGEAPVVFIRDEDYQVRKLAIDQIKSALNSQGFHRIHFWDEGYSVSTLPFVLLDSPHQADESWIHKHLTADPGTLTGFVVFDFGPVEQANEIEERVIDICNRLLGQNPGLAKAIIKFRTMSDTLLTLSGKNKELSERLSGAEKTISVIRTKYKDDYENLFKWYHNEYEILPLWYKRFGHILKVLMGKRTFRSLFSDDVKKYKS